jgi:ABC-type phosphate transport system ATPase subunit
VAAKKSYGESLIAQVEDRFKAASPELAKALDRAFSTPGFTEDDHGGEQGTPGTFGRIVVRLRNMPFPASFRSFATYEAEAVALSTYQHSLVPGLLQTEDYARAILQTRAEHHARGSGGEQQMLALSRAYLTKPRVILVDEPSLGLAPRIIDQIYELLTGFAARGISLVVVEQYVQRALALADKVYILSRGEVIHVGKASELDPDEIYQRYLGIEA